MIELKQDKNRYIYYQSLYWRIYNYVLACQQLSFKKNTDAVIDNKSEKVVKIVNKVVQKISKITDSIPVVGIVIEIISSALEFAFSNYLDYKFNQIVKKLTQIVQVRCNSGIDIDEEIQWAIIIKAKELPEIDQDLQIEQLGLLKYLQQIFQTESDSGNQYTQNPCWKQGIADTLKILHNLLFNYEQIQLDQKKELHIVILQQFKDDNLQVQKVDNPQAVKAAKRLNSVKIFDPLPQKKLFFKMM